MTKIILNYERSLVRFKKEKKKKERGKQVG